MAVHQVGTSVQLDIEKLKELDPACISFEQQILDYEEHKFEKEARERAMDRAERWKARNEERVECKEKGEVDREEQRQEREEQKLLEFERFQLMMNDLVKKEK